MEAPHANSRQLRGTHRSGGLPVSDTGAYLNSREAAALLGVCLRTLGNLRSSQAIPYFKVGRQIRYRQDALESAVKVNSVSRHIEAGESPPVSECTGMRKRSKKWPRLYTRRYSTGIVKYGVDLGKQGNKKRDRRIFDSQKERDQFVAQARAACEVQGQVPFFLPHEIQSQAVVFFRFLQDNNLGDFNSVRQHYEKDIIPYLTAPNLSEIAQQMLEEMDVAKGDRDTSIKTVRGIVNEFVAFIGGQRKITDIKPNEVSDFIFRPGRVIGGRTKKNRRAVVSQVFNFAMRNEWIAKNLASRLPLPRVTHRKKRVLTVEECWNLLTHANEFGLLGFAVAVLLCGVRTEEAQKIPWSCCHDDDHIIEVPEWAAKIHVGRDVPINPTAAAWLPICGRRGGQLVDMTNHQKNFDDWRDAAGIEDWPPNALRRSFASYHYAAFKDAKETARIIGHIDGERTLFKYYIVHVPEKDAKKFFAVRPLATHAKLAA
jgi:site-specific recombinase XerC